ncbi:MAG: N-acetylmuramoyl-L-alanine amidase [Bacteroidales bacterium]|nr:N-acetylmuramoyl-L-alanine amidase [Bacteroidales bacterium]
MLDALFPIHVNAAGSGRMWHNATGWCAYTFPGHTESDKLAFCLYKAAQRHLPGHRLRTDYSDGDPDFEKPFYILKHTYCAAVLTENGFMDSEVSLSFLESEERKKAIVALHMEGIEEYVISIV